MSSHLYLIDDEYEGRIEVNTLHISNIKEGLASFGELYTPKHIATVNDTQLMLVKVEGDKVPWHTHSRDEGFMVYRGCIRILTRSKEYVLGKGEFMTIPAGIEHRIVSLDLSEVILFEASDFKHTGNVTVDITKDTFGNL